MRTFTDGKQIYEPPMGVCACGQRLETSGGHWRIRHYDEKQNVIYEVCIHGITTVDNRPEIKPKKMEFNSKGYDIDITGGILKAIDELSDDIGVTHETVEGIVVDEVDEQVKEQNNDYIPMHFVLGKEDE